MSSSDEDSLKAPPPVSDSDDDDRQGSGETKSALDPVAAVGSGDSTQTSSRGPSTSKGVGDVDEDEVAEGDGNMADQSNGLAGLEAEDEEDEDDLFGDNDQDDMPVPEIQGVELEKQQLPWEAQLKQQAMLLAMPQTLSATKHQFDPETYRSKVVRSIDATGRTRFKLGAEHAIRWRKEGDSIVSNAQMVEWDDGSMSLMIGEECYDIIDKPPNTHTHVYKSVGSEHYQAMAPCVASMALRSSGGKGQAHRSLAKRSAAEGQGAGRVIRFTTDVDPRIRLQEARDREREAQRRQNKHAKRSTRSRLQREPMADDLEEYSEDDDAGLFEPTAEDEDFIESDD
eukprot:m.83837 g.83837  ORF g.83837 m.83837 type:complete len:341 (+) comp12729_c0_seq5:30-1052(+)